jgi:molybdopterin-guanine dinucleotide biosynthesis protein B
VTKLCVIRIAGAKNSGKTTLIASLTKELISLGYRVGTVKHTSHDHEFDSPGSDSYRQVEAGSVAAAVISPNKFVCHSQRPTADRLESIVRVLFADTDVVLYEGFTAATTADTAAPLIECVAPGKVPLYLEDRNLAAVIHDERIDGPIHRFTRSNVGELARWINETYLEISRTEDDPA